jgi:hypothetical protein
MSLSVGARALRRILTRPATMLVAAFAATAMVPHRAAAQSVVSPAAGGAPRPLSLAEALTLATGESAQIDGRIRAWLASRGAAGVKCLARPLPPPAFFNASMCARARQREGREAGGEQEVGPPSSLAGAPTPLGRGAGQGKRCVKRGLRNCKTQQ